jgi:hypothetical protein
MKIHLSTFLGVPIKPINIYNLQYEVGIIYPANNHAEGGIADLRESGRLPMKMDDL